MHSCANSFTLVIWETLAPPSIASALAMWHRRASVSMWHGKASVLMWHGRASVSRLHFQFTEGKLTLPLPKSTPLLLKLISCMTPYILPWSETMITLTHSRIPLVVSPAKRLFIVRSTLCKASFTCMWKLDSFQGNPILASFPGHSHLQFLIACSR